MTDPDCPDRLTEARAALAVAMALHEQGDLDGAEAAYRNVLAQDYRTSEVLPLLAGLLGRLSRAEDALAAWDQLLGLHPDHAVALHEKGLTLNWLGRTAEATVALERACAIDPDNPVAIGNLAVVLAGSGRNLDAIRQFRRALALQPGNLHLRHQIRRLGSGSVPFWHIPMMNDAPRNDAFEAAIRAAIAVAGPDARVLDIGAGSGLLSLMAARAGARKVVACEMDPMVADMAQQIVARNGYADRITGSNSAVPMSHLLRPSWPWDETAGRRQRVQFRLAKTRTQIRYCQERPLLILKLAFQKCAEALIIRAGSGVKTRHNSGYDCGGTGKSGIGNSGHAIKPIGPAEQAGSDTRP